MIVPEDDWATAREKWRSVERLGFDHAWTYDHLNWRAFRDRNWYTAFPTMAAAAVETQRIKIGVLVASPNLRHPVHLAKDAATVDDMAQGRLILGMGSGADGFDARMTRSRTWSRRERTERFAEYIALTDQLLSHPVTTFEGHYYTADEVRSYPTRDPRIPLAVAAAGPRGMQLAARHGQYWVTTGAPNAFDRAPYTDALPVVRRQVAALEEACAGAGRNPDTLSRLLVAGPTVGGVLDSVESFFDASDKFAEAGITDLVVQWPRPDEPFAGDVDVLEQIGMRLQS